MSYASYSDSIRADTNPFHSQEWDVNRPPNMMSYDSGHTMRYTTGEETTRQYDTKMQREQERPVDSGDFHQHPGIAHSSDSTEDWQPWMQRVGIPVAQHRLMDLPSEQNYNASSFGQYGASETLDDMEGGYQIRANENSVFRSHRIDTYQSQDLYS